MVCFDERPCQLLAEVREPLGLGAGRPERRDHEYERRGTAHVSMAFEPLSGWRRTSVTERRRGREFAEEVRRLVEEDYPRAERLRLVLDNLSTHTAAAFYQTFPPEVARRLARKVEFCYTPVHGSWLNMVEIEISVLAPMLEAPNSGHRDPGSGSERLVRGAKPAPSERGMALHDTRCPSKATQALSIH